MQSQSTRPRAGTLLQIAFICIMLFTGPLHAMAGELRLSAGAGMRDALKELTSRYSKQHPGTIFISNFASSGTLAGQIMNGAPVDIFISANRKWMDFLKKENAVDPASIQLFTGNTLVFTGTSATKVLMMQDLVKLDKIAIGSPGSVPAGDYAMSAITGAGLRSRLEGKLVMARDVRECLMYAELGEVDGGFVYATDAILAKKATTRFEVPQKLYPPIEFPMALTLSGAKKNEARAFLLYLRSPEARTVLKKYGYKVN
jgi:molybdate transport system substrate-binding protein